MDARSISNILSYANRKSKPGELSWCILLRARISDPIVQSDKVEHFLIDVHLLDRSYSRCLNP